MMSRDFVPSARSGLALLVGVALLGMEGKVVARDAAAGESAGHPYTRIPARNIFGVKPPAPPAPVEKPPEPPKDRPEFFLTGLTRRGSKVRAFIAFQPKGKPIEYPKALIEGVETPLEVDEEQIGTIKLVSIGDDGESVQVEYNGEALTLDFEKNAAKAMGPSGAPAVPGQPGANPNAPKGTLPPPPVPTFGSQPNTTISGLQGAGAAGPTVVGRGGEVLGGFSAPAATLNGSAAFSSGVNSGLPAIQAGGSATSGGISVPAVQGVIETDPATVTRRRNRDVPLPPFPGLPGN